MKLKKLKKKLLLNKLVKWVMKSICVLRMKKREKTALLKSGSCSRLATTFDQDVGNRSENTQELVVA